MSAFSAILNVYSLPGYVPYNVSISTHIFFSVTKELETIFSMLLFLLIFTANYFIYGVGSCMGTLCQRLACVPFGLSLHWFVLF